jgi:succinoglycan biosynthesis transport protein ExoP
VDDEVKTFADYLAMLRRRKRTALAIFLLVAITGIYLTFLIEPVYIASATFRVQQQSIAEYLDTPTSGYVDEQIQMVRQRVMSPERLSEIIDTYQLYPEQTGGGPANYYAVERLRSAIDLEPETAEVFNPRSGRTTLVTIAFEMFFEHSQPETTQKVAADIASLFLAENQRIRTAQAGETIDFLERELETSQLEVDRAAAARAEFRERHAGNLPDMTDFNLQAMERLERQIDAVDEDIRTARDRKQILEGELADPNLLATVTDRDGNPIVGTAQRLSELQRERLQLLSTYSPQHPDVVRIEKEIEILAQDMSVSGANASDIRNQLDFASTDLAVARERYSEDHPEVRRLVRAVETLQQQLSLALARPNYNVNLTSQDPVVQGLLRRIEAQETDIQTFQSRRAELRAEMAEYENKMLRMPQIDREWAGLTRDSEAAIARNKEIRERLDGAKTAGNLEAEGGGARFILTDSPQLPSSPYKPNRTALLILSLLMAAIIGVGIAITVDSMDGTVQESRDVLRISDAPPIAIIPFIETAQDYRRRIAANIGTSGLVLGCIALIVVIARNAA